MWYFAWILGIVAALCFGIINVMWYEAEAEARGLDNDGDSAAS